MSLKISLKKGFDINLIGGVGGGIINSISSSSFALKPGDFIGITRPKSDPILIEDYELNVINILEYLFFEVLYRNKRFTPHWEGSRHGLCDRAFFKAFDVT